MTDYWVFLYIGGGVSVVADECIEKEELKKKQAAAMHYWCLPAVGYMHAIGQVMLQLRNEAYKHEAVMPETKAQRQQIRVLRGRFEVEYDEPK